MPKQKVDDDSRNSEPNPVLNLSISFFGMFLTVGYSIVCWIFGLADFDRGSESPSTLLILPLIVLLIYFVLIFPFSSIVYKGTFKDWNRCRRIFTMFLLISLPLLSFAYYRGGVKLIMDLHEWWLIVLPAVAVGVLFFDKRRNPWEASLLIGLGVSVPLFVCNDVLLPYPTVWTYLSVSKGFYLWRTLLPLLGVWWALWWTRSEGAVRQNFAYAFMGLAFYTVVIKFLIPVTVAIKEGMAWDTYIMWDFWWVAHLVGSYALLNPKRWGFLFLIGMTYVEIGIVVTKFGLYFFDLQTDYWRLSWFANKVFVLGLFIWLAWLLAQPSFRNVFKSSSPPLPAECR